MSRAPRPRPSPGYGVSSGSADENNATSAQLEERTVQLHSVQRNYDTMSRMVQARAKEMEQVWDRFRYAHSSIYCVLCTSPGVQCTLTQHPISHMSL